MNDLKSFGSIATSLARNPLGIIALFIVLVYGFACLVTASATHFTSQERLPLIWFMTLFPVLVLAVFAWLVSCHSAKLFAPSDFKDESNFVNLTTAVGSLAAATSKTDTLSDVGIRKIIETVQASASAQILEKPSWKRSLLWVDDSPENNIYERQAFEAVGLNISLAHTTSEAFEILARQRVAAIISDMDRREGPREGYVLLNRLRQQHNEASVFFYTASSAPEHKQETREHGGQGCTNSAEELYGMVLQAVSRY